MNAALLSLFGFGFLLGMKHAFDADHIAAMAALDSKNPSMKGLFWGVGHTISLLAIGIAVLLFKINIPKKVALSFEFIAGMMLIVIGLNVLMTIKRHKIHLHKHRHGTKKHLHLHSHFVGKSHNHGHKPLFVGLVHGLAGSAALVLLVLSAINSIPAGILYILVFGIGSIAGMLLMIKIISLPLGFMMKNFRRSDGILRLGAGFGSLAIGTMMVYSTWILF